MASFMVLMEKMMGQHEEGCDCADMMSQFASQMEVPEEWQKVMAQMMAYHCGSQEVADTTAQEA